MNNPPLLQLGSDLGRDHPALQLLLLFGSRARGDGTPTSDWDLGFLAVADFDSAAAAAQVVAFLGTDRVDFVDLRYASGLLRQRAARDGICLFDRGGQDLAFRTEVSLAWCDMEPVLRRAYDGVLARALR